MFRDDFKNELDEIKVPEDVRKSVLKKIENAENKKTPLKVRNGKRRYLLSAVAAVLCISIVAAVGGIFKRPSLSDKRLSAADKVSYSSVYSLFKEIYDEEQSKKLRNGFSGLINGFFSKGYDTTENETADEANDFNAEVGTNTTGTQYQSDYDTSDEAKNGDYSETNTQVKGVDEGDVVKTDGRYIYILKKATQEVNIISADGKSSNKVAEITGISEDEAYIGISDMYVKNGRLVLIKQEYAVNGESRNTVADIYDVTIPEKPVFLKSLSQSGDYLSSRLSGDVLYIFTNQSFYNKPSKEDVTTYVPSIGDEKGSKAIKEENLCCFTDEIERSYFVATSVNIKSGKRIDEEAVLGGGETVYVNDSSVYAAVSVSAYNNPDNKESGENTDKTDFLRLSTENGKITYYSSGSVKGTLLNQFSMDEYNGYFRVVTTVGKYGSALNDDKEETLSDIVDVSDDFSTTNSLYILNRQLETVGKIEGLADNERVYSVRFDGDVGYFVTFRQVDPLFTVDLSNPTAPKILSQLKIPGFSSYLHPYGEGLLLGIGKNADEKSGAVGSVKLSMFDVSDPENVSEKDVISLSVAYTQAESTHKAVLADSEKNIIGFAGSDYKTEAYYIFGYSKSGFYLKAKLEITGKIGYDVRGIYVDDYFYLCTQNSVTVYTLNEFEKVTQLCF